MSAETVDSNVLVYAHDASAGSKRDVASRLLQELGDSDRLVFPLQVLEEFFVVVTRKIASPLAPARAMAIVRDLAAKPVFGRGLPDLFRAVEMQGSHSLQFWDALLLATCESSGVATLWSEDLSNRARYGRVRVVNPFNPRS